jgi:hypothetical protein
MNGMAQIAVSLDTYKAIEAARLSLAESHDEIVRRVLAARRSQRGTPARIAARATAPAQRRRGDVAIELFGKRVPVANLKAAYIAALNALVRHKPSLFEHLASEGGKRRRWIARDAARLFPGSPHLARDHAQPLAGEWLLDTNLSRAQIEARLARAADIAGYRYGEDLKIIGR